MYLAFSGNINFAKKFIETYKGKKYKKLIYKHAQVVYEKLDFQMVVNYRKSMLQNDSYYQNTEIIFIKDIYSINENLYTTNVIKNHQFAIDSSLEKYLKLPRLIRRHESYLIAVHQEYQKDKIDFKNYNLIKKSAKIYWNYNFEHVSTDSFRDVINEQYDNIEEAEEYEGYSIEKPLTRVTKKIETDKIRIAITNIEVPLNDINPMIRGTLIRRRDKYHSIARLLNDAKVNNVDIIIFPEISIPFEWLSPLSYFAYKNGILITGGLEFINYNSRIINIVFTILPYRENYMIGADIILRPKNYYAPEELEKFEAEGMHTPDYKALYHIFNWNGIMFTVFNCFELAAINDRNYFKGKIDLLLGILWNRDRFYFENIAASSVRDLHCYLANVNTSQYKGTFLMQPTTSVTIYLSELKGGKNNTFVAEDIDVQALREFQKNPADSNPKEFKPLPPGFKIDPNRL